MTTPIGAFSAACDQQGISERFGHGGRTGVITLLQRYHRDVLIDENTSPNLSAELDINKIPDIGPLRMLGALANVSSGYEAGIYSDHVIANPAAFKGRDGDCPNAEEYWNNTLESLTKETQPLAEVYVDDDGAPIAVRKGRGGKPTAILLQPVHVIDDEIKPFTYPSGSLMHLSAIGDDKRITQVGPASKLEVPGKGLVRPWSDVTGMSYLRQTAIAYDNRAFIEAEGRSYAERVTVDEPWTALRTLAQQIIQQA